MNTYGSYQCTCREGYKLGPDRRTCQGKLNQREFKNSKYKYKYLIRY